MTRPGDWIQTFTGGMFWPLDPRASEVVIEDIAHSLAMSCRFRGHCRRFYSVAEHSVLVSRNVPPADALAALLHDGAEAYLSDVPRPLKRFLPGFAAIEDRVEAAIAERFGLPHPMPASVKRVDTAILHDEARFLLGPHPADWSIPGEPLGLHESNFWCLPPDGAEQLFLIEFRRLTGSRA